MQNIDQAIKCLGEFDKQGYVVSNEEGDRFISIPIEEFAMLIEQLELDPLKVKVSIDYKGYKVYGYIKDSE